MSKKLTLAMPSWMIACKQCTYQIECRYCIYDLLKQRAYDK